MLETVKKKILSAASSRKEGGVTAILGSSSVALEPAAEAAHQIVREPSGRYKFFGLLRVVDHERSDQAERLCQLHYVGPRSRILVTLSIVFGGCRSIDGEYAPVYVDSKSCSFDWHRGLIGPGAAIIQRHMRLTGANKGDLD